MSFNESEYDKQYKKEHYDRIMVKLKKESDIKEQLKLLSVSTNKSVNQLLIEAIELLFKWYDKQ